MSRGYTHKKYRRIVDTIRRYVPDAIAGFLGETEAQFENTLKLMSDIVFARTSTAAYSPRPGTPAALWS